MGYTKRVGWLAVAALGAMTWLSACGSDEAEGAFDGNDAATGCTKDLDCKGDRVCNAGACVDPVGSGGSGGSTGSGGSSGVSGGGSAGTGTGGSGVGGSAGSTDAGEDAGGGDGSSGSGGGAGVVRCGTEQCDLGVSERCCSVPGGGGPPTLECQSSSDAGPGGCVTSYRCDGDEDCPAGACCATRGAGPFGQLSSFACEDSCGSGALHVGCRGSSTCPQGQVCCGSRTGAAPGMADAYTNIECSATCDGQNQTVLCDSQDDCSGDAGTCNPSTILPAGFTVCS
jgi:hypothetical protein